MEAEAKVAFLSIAEGIQAGVSEDLPGEEVPCENGDIFREVGPQAQTRLSQGTEPNSIIGGDAEKVGASRFREMRAASDQ